jgi:hypothetical protein
MSQIDRQIQEILNELPDQLSVIEKGVDLSVQQEYLEYTESIVSDR